MEATNLVYDPSEFEIIETFDFEEEVARPESLRFFTLDEQLVDYFNAVLPKKKKISKFEYRKLANEVDRIRDVYETFITISDTEYTTNSLRRAIHVPWVKPIYSEFKLNPFSFKTNWEPLFQEPQYRAPNYYSRMVAALPKPFTTTEGGIPLTEDSVCVNEEGGKAIQFLKEYNRTKGVISEDGTFKLVDVPITNTADDIKRKGFFIEKREDEIPRALAGHPFFESNQEKSIITDDTFLDVFPTIEAIMTHGVPITKFPYTEGNKFLKLYDVNLSEIPWNLWKDRFPPMETITETPKVISLTFENQEIEAPSEALQKAYLIKWTSGIEPRHWMATQEDNGNFVIKMLLSQVYRAGKLPPAINEPVAEQPITSTPEDCLSSEDFEKFMQSGIYRSPKWSDVEKAISKSKALPLGTCVPITEIMQQRSEAISSNKLAFGETEGQTIVEEHSNKLKKIQVKSKEIIVSKYEKFANSPISDLRRMILAVLKDDERLPEDKATDIEKLLKEFDSNNEVYYDDAGSFLICSHTLAILKGHLERDNAEFHERWTTAFEGFRNCNHCGERISADVYSKAEEFDENGLPIISREKIDGFVGEGHVATFNASLAELKSLFNLNNAGDSTFYLLLSLFQVLPKEDQLLPIIGFVKGTTAALKANTKIPKDKKEVLEGVLGVTGMVILLQTHNPFLIPRRSFGSKILKLTGFPRDTPDVNDAPTLDIIISVLKTTFESTPGTFKGAIGTFVRKVISKPKEVRKECINLIKTAEQKFKTQFETAKTRYSEIPAIAESVETISFPVLKLEKSEFSTSEGIGAERLSECKVTSSKSYIAGESMPSVRQESVLLDQTNVSERAFPVQRMPVLIEKIELTEKEISRRNKLKFPKNSKLSKIEDFLKAENDGIAYLALYNRILDVLSFHKFSIDSLIEHRRVSVYLETLINSSTLRDILRGIIVELMIDISDKKNIIETINEMIKKDLIFNMILISKQDATKEETALRTRERETFKQRMRQMDDTNREVTKMLLDIGIAPFVITNEDREIFSREYNYVDPESEMVVELHEDQNGEPIIEEGDYGGQTEELYSRGEYENGNED
jgi:hypothetical protein